MCAVVLITGAATPPAVQLAKLPVSKPPFPISAPGGTVRLTVVVRVADAPVPVTVIA